MAIAHQGKVIGAEYDTSYDQLDASYFGTCATLTMTSDHTILVGQQESQQLQARINQIQSQLDETSGIDQYLLELRLSKLTGGISVIRVGGATEIEQNELKLRIEDSINATNSATKEGIVAGGGTTLLKAREYIKEWIDTLQDDVRLGATIIYDSLKQPLLQICANGHVHGEVILDKIAQSQLDNAGYDASTGKIVNMIETGILDPKKVTRCALQNACSVASTMLTTQCVITSTPTQSSK